jgi:hypothetical protein
MVLKNLVVGSIFLVFASSITSNAGLPSATMEGHLKIISPRAVEPSDNMPRPAAAPEVYAKYSLIILSEEGQKEIARVTQARLGIIGSYYRPALIF